jgi:hypothetical protein
VGRGMRIARARRVNFFDHMFFLVRRVANLYPPDAWKRRCREFRSSPVHSAIMTDSRMGPNIWKYLERV